jgi:hypothetical protein
VPPHEMSNLKRSAKMKNFRSVLLIIWTLLITACQTNVPGGSQRITEPNGIAHEVRSSDIPYEVDIGPLIPFITDADWTSERIAGAWFTMKDPIRIELRNGQKIIIDRMNGRFEISGVRGSFIMQNRNPSVDLHALLQSCLKRK